MAKQASKKKIQYLGTGRSKKAIARVRLIPGGTGAIVINADKAILTGNKLEKKYYRHHTGWVGHLKEVKYSTLMNKNPEFAYELAVKGMIPNTVLGRNALRRLRIYKGAEHPHAAQKPEVWNID